MVAMRGRTRRVVGRQIVKGCGNSCGVEIFPKRHALSPEHCGRRLVVEGPEVELELVIAQLPAARTGDGFRRRIKRSTLLVRVPVNEVKDPVREAERALMKFAQATGLCGGMLVPAC